MRNVLPLSETVEIELTSADILRTVEDMNGLGIELRNTQLVGELTLHGQIKRKDLKSAAAYAAKKGITLRVLREWGIQKILKKVVGRPLLTAGLVLIFALCWTVPNRIFVIQVDGNYTVPERRILEAAESCGIRFGASRREVRSEKIKNALLSALPELRWAGVNTYGSRAVISVREREPESAAAQQHGVSSIIACRDGVILSGTVTRGTGLVKPGDAVQQGQILISGYTDCGIAMAATRAEGEFFAQTVHQLTLKMPLDCEIRSGLEKETVRFSLLLGKKRINFYKGSGIYDSRCVKMYSKYVLTLPGGISLPVALIRETVRWYPTDTGVLSTEAAEADLSDYAQRYLESQMIAGTVLGKREEMSVGNCCVLDGTYDCREMIGRVKAEEIGVYNGKTD